LKALAFASGLRQWRWAAKKGIIVFSFAQRSAKPL
jgi:hypothetical protein